LFHGTKALADPAMAKPARAVIKLIFCIFILSF
jgi:hypothetical protein